MTFKDKFYPPLKKNNSQAEFFLNKKKKFSEKAKQNMFLW